MKTRLTRGLTAGFIAAATFALFFLFVDLVRGRPFHTPAYMSGLLFSFTTALPATARLLTFTALHFLAFGIVGALATVLLDKLRVAPRLYLGVLLGFLLFDLLFYASVLFIGVDVVRALGWPAVLGGNILAGTVMFAYLKARSGMPVMALREDLRNHPTIRRGLISGLIGATAVAVWFLVLDAIQQRVFYTPAALGSGIFLGANDADDVVIRADIVLAYTLLHTAAFILVGLVAAWLLNEVHRNANALIGVVLLFVTLEVLSLGILAAVAAWLFDTLPWWSPVVANIVAAATMATYLLRNIDLSNALGRETRYAHETVPNSH